MHPVPHRPVSAGMGGRLGRADLVCVRIGNGEDHLAAALDADQVVGAVLRQVGGVVGHGRVVVAAGVEDRRGRALAPSRAGSAPGLAVRGA